VKGFKKLHGASFIVFFIFLLFVLGCGTKTIKKAKDFMEIGMYKEAIFLLEKEVLKHPKNAEVHFLLGKAYLYTSEGEKAKVSFDRAVKVKIKMKDAVVDEYLKLAFELIEEGRLESERKILILFDQIINLNPNAKRRIAQELIQTAEKLDDNNLGKAWCLEEAIKYLDRDKDSQLIEIINRKSSEETIQNLLNPFLASARVKDSRTMSAMAFAPIKMDVESWEIISESEERVEPASLPELKEKELESRKQVEISVGITLDAKDALLDAEYERDQARTRAARRATQNKFKELQATYDEIYAAHQQLQTDHNEAKAATAREEQITSFSLGTADIPNIKDLTGHVHFKEVEVKVIGKSGTKNYKFYLRRYILRDKILNLPRRGRWIIAKIKKIS